MDASRFDAIARSLHAPTSRRAAVAAAIASLFALGPLPLAAKKKKKIELCHEGQTIKVPKKKKKAHLAHGDTLGACPTSPPPPATGCTLPCGACQQCESNACVPLSDDTACNGDGKCLAGVCNPKPACLGRSDTTCTASDQCCTGHCDVGDSCNTPGLIDGFACQENGDCISQACVGYRCIGAGGCKEGKGYCLNGVTNASDCPCFLTKESGVRAGVPPPSGYACGDCQDSDECVAKHGPGAFCAVDNGDNCPCAFDQHFCALPC